MNTLLKPLLETILGSLKSRTALQLELLALRQQLAMIAERCLQTLHVFQPDTLLRWHRKGFSIYWNWNHVVVGAGDQPLVVKHVNL